jgi:preprotein translocase subunit SecG
MRTFLYTLHIVTCLSLVVVVLIQRGKGADMGAMLGGGGSQTVFGARGAGNFLTKLTTSAAILFMVTSLTLSYFATQDSRATIFDDEVIEETLPATGALEEAGDAGAGLLEEIDDASAGLLEEIEPAPAQRPPDTP